MTWQQARQLIEAKIGIGTDLNTYRSTYRVVTSVGSIRNSERYGYHSENGFVVQIGKSDHINIPWKMLEKCFLPLSLGGEYDFEYFHQPPVNFRPGPS